MMYYEDIRLEGIEVPAETLNEGMDLEGTGVDFSGNYSLDLWSCLGKECKEEPKTTETVTLLEVAKFIPELRADEEIEENSGSAMAATTTNSKKAAEGGQSPSESSARGDHMSGLEDCSDKEHQKKLKTCDMATFLQVSKFTEELRTDGVIEENNASAVVGTRTNSGPGSPGGNIPWPRHGSSWRRHIAGPCCHQLWSANTSSTIHSPCLT